MIIFKTLHITAFKSIFDVTLDFNSLSKNFYSLEGINNTVEFASSNGTGKSTIFDALSYALYGSVSGIYVKKDDYKNKNSNLKTKIELEFDVKDKEHHSYKIIRTLDTLQLFKDDEDISELTKTATDKKLQDILNLSKEDFYNFTYITQTGNSFLTKTASEKLTILKDFVFGDELSELEQKLNTIIKETKNQIQTEKLELSNIEGKLSGIQQINNKTLFSLEETEKIKTEIQNLTEESKQLRIAYEKEKEEEKERIKLENRHSSLLQSFNNLKGQMQQIRENVCPLCKQHLVDDVAKTKIECEAQELKREILDIRKRLKVLPQTENKIKLSEVTEIEHKLSDLQSTLRQQIEQEQFNKKKHIWEQEKKELTKQIQILESELEQETKLQKYFKTTFVQQVQQQFLDTIENYLNLYCYDVFDAPFKLLFNNGNLELLVGDKPYSFYSGGERQRINFLFVFAIKLVLLSFTNKCTNLLLFDESLSAQDKQAYENCVDIISELSKANEIKTILISHREVNASIDKIILKRNKNSTELSIITV